MDSKTDGTKTDKSPPAHEAAEVLAAGPLVVVEEPADSEPSDSSSDDHVPPATAAVPPAAGGAGEQGRLASLVPTLGRFADRAHKASAPYLSYAAMASQEAARYTSSLANTALPVALLHAAGLTSPTVLHRRGTYVKQRRLLLVFLSGGCCTLAESVD